jgi:predicted lipoprotein with Yx(FWY)xxD motif
MHSMRKSKTLVLAAGLLGVPLTLVACGSTGTTSAAGLSGSPSVSLSQGSTSTVKLASVTGVGTVLVDGDNHVLYTPIQEADGKIRCTDSCLQAWPAVFVASVPSVAGATGTFGTIDRDGKKQLTYNGAPVYTFAFDKGGEASGNNASDSFGGQNFNWRALSAAGTAPNSPGASSSSSSASPQASDDHDSGGHGADDPSGDDRGGSGY